jgi:HEPN domain-containing protein
MTGIDQNNINKTELIKHLINTSEDDFRTMLILFESKSYNWALFLGHISVEKLLKALYVKKFGQHAPFTHNLYRLAELCDIKLTDEYSDWFDKITSFNINARYNDHKKEFYSQCTPEFTEYWINIIKTLREWIKQML